METGDWTIRCPCGINEDTRGATVMCDTCSVWQHTGCVNEDEHNLPDEYYCEWCDPQLFYERTGFVPDLPPSGHKNYEVIKKLKEAHPDKYVIYIIIFKNI